MKIAATMVSMEAARNYTDVEQNNTTWQRGFPTPESFSQPQQSLAGNIFQQKFSNLIHCTTTSQQSATCLVTPQGMTAGAAQEAEDSYQSQIRDKSLSTMVQNVSGTSVTVQQIISHNPNQLTESSPPLSTGKATLASSSIHLEQESIYFQAEGAVQTESGEHISFNMGLQMQRNEVMIQSAGFGNIIHGIDPIILNFDDNMSLFDQTFFSFDLDGDGSCEELSSLGSGCGFLALDRDGDGLISDGLELFGPATDNGFGELADLDTDGNSWIDENDPIFDKLLVWIGAGGEEEQLVSLKEAGVGAISVLHAGTQFTLKNQTGDVQGFVKANGLFLMENGEPRSLQEIDLVPGKEQRDNGIVAIQEMAVGTRDSIENLRDIIFWQRLRLKMSFGQKLLNNPRDEMVKRLQHLYSGLSPNFS
ncbi:MAG: hypothetical protein ACI8ZB_000303 [Desulforhopalus sp.]|jgi:hypothetical protein